MYKVKVNNIHLKLNGRFKQVKKEILMYKVAMMIFKNNN